MQVKALSVTYGGKLSLGNYNSVHLELTLDADLEPGEDADDAARQLFERGRAMVREAAIPYRPRLAENVRDALMEETWDSNLKA